MQHKAVLAAAAALLLAACAPLIRESPVPGETAPAQPGAFQAVQGRGPDVVARLRAAPAPADPVVAQGATPGGDEALLRARGLVKIGTARYAESDAAGLARRVRAQAREVAADQALFYTASSDALASAQFFVRLQLPFGANFRDLTDAERETLGQGGVEIGEVVGRTPASEANLREGDFVLRLNKTQVHDRAHFQALLQEHMGRRVTLTIRRDGATIKRLVVLGKLPAPAAP